VIPSRENNERRTPVSPEPFRKAANALSAFAVATAILAIAFTHLNPDSPANMTVIEAFYWLSTLVITLAGLLCRTTEKSLDPH
jgi:hypothetical protein